MSLTDDDKSRIRLEEVFREEVRKEFAANSQASVGLDSDSLFRFFRAYPTLVGTLFYLQMSTVGVLYKWVLFSEFGINVFEFAELKDFLLAAFNGPSALGLVFFTLLLVIGAVVWLQIMRGTPKALLRLPGGSMTLLMFMIIFLRCFHPLLEGGIMLLNFGWRRGVPECGVPSTARSQYAAGICTWQARQAPHHTGGG